ncbi:MAG: N-acetylmuramic acid 6-phosphate etherase [Elusimicrobiota bacterium]
MIEGRYRRLPTEQPNPASRNIDARRTLDIVRIMQREDARVPRATARAAANIARAVELIARSLRDGGRLIFVGAGTSGRLGVIEAAECPPTFGTPPGLVRAIMAGGRGAVFRSKEGAEDDAQDGGRRARAVIRRGDVVVGIAASGITPFVRGALAAARRAGCRTVLVTSNTRRQAQPADVRIAVGVGPEVLTGSTRLKAATAAKLVLNTLTTAAMIRLGKVYDHWMVDLKPSSRKLRQRALRILCDLGRVDAARARRLLRDAGGSVKTAVLMSRRGLSAAAANRRLRGCAGSLRAALENKKRKVRR